MSGNEIRSQLSAREIDEALGNDNRWYAGAKYGIPINDDAALAYYWQVTRVPQSIFFFTVHETEEKTDPDSAGKT